MEKEEETVEEVVTTPDLPSELWIKVASYLGRNSLTFDAVRLVCYRSRGVPPSRKNFSSILGY